MEVSVVVVTYNSDVKKTLRTLDTILAQSGVEFEIIISDDGSANNNFEKIREYFSEKNYSMYKLIENKNNNGTVKNCLIGSTNAAGEYLFLTSPGDLLFDKKVLKDFYDFAKSKNSKIVFGDYIGYQMNNGKINPITNIDYAPGNISAYNKSFYETKISFIFSGNILGASIFREREYAIKTFKQILPYAKYMEDNTSIAVAFAEGIQVHYYNRNILWYEYSTGISSKAGKWSKILGDEYKNVYEYLYKKYPKDKLISIRHELLFSSNPKKTKIKMLILHPIISMKRLKYLKACRNVSYSNKDIENISAIIKDNI